MHIHLENNAQAAEIADTIKFLAENRDEKHTITIFDPSYGEPMPSFEGFLVVETKWETPSGAVSIGDQKIIAPNGDFLYLTN